jgi:hypothetical protein
MAFLAFLRQFDPDTQAWMLSLYRSSLHEPLFEDRRTRGRRD